MLPSVSVAFPNLIPPMSEGRSIDAKMSVTAAPAPIAAESSSAVSGSYFPTTEALKMEAMRSYTLSNVSES